MLAQTRGAVGPVGLAMKALKQVGGRWEVSWNVVVGFSSVALDHVVLDNWAHEVRAALRITLWNGGGRTGLHASIFVD